MENQIQISNNKYMSCRMSSARSGRNNRNGANSGALILTQSSEQLICSVGGEGALFMFHFITSVQASQA